MQSRQITLEDGRYLIFYTFAEETTEEAPANSTESARAEEAAGAEESSVRRAEPDAEPQSTEEPGRV